MGTEIQVAVRDPKSFVDAEVWNKEISLLMRDYPFDLIMAERVFGQAVAYLVTAIEMRGRRLGMGPGELVDLGVHAFILDTRNYREFCARYMDGGFLDHIPEVARKGDGSVFNTAKIIESNGFAVDWPLWEKDAMTCTPCRPGEDGH
ncbi:glycine-rich domain-containing protein [Streptomyces laurentii]|uniref:glycine-rich domain-containing protein n=1 Tax=Streptomyces laurentii TaxID=39478 RepID=UPI0036B4F30E